MTLRQALALLACLAGPLLLAGCIERYFFYPDRVAYSRPQDFGLDYRDVAFPARDGSRLHGWWLPARGAARGVVLHLHGNGANISNHLPLVAWLPAAGYHVLTFDYRGYGDSEGAPTLDGVVEDAQAALAFLAARPESEGLPLFVLGQSLGGATAIRALAAGSPERRRVCGLVADSAFAGYRRIAADAVRQNVLLGSAVAVAKYGLPPPEQDPERLIGGLGMPLLLLHGRDDAIVPFHHGEQLLAAAAAPKSLFAIAGGEHIDGLARPDVRQRVLAFFDASHGCGGR